jgi:hypothetical protein
MRDFVTGSSKTCELGVNTIFQTDISNPSTSPNKAAPAAVITVDGKLLLFNDM